MYLRVRDSFDVDMLREEYSGRVDDEIIGIVDDRIKRLEDAYGAGQPDQTGYGGYLLFFPTPQDCMITYPKVLSHYGLDDDLNEYDDIIDTASSNQRWHEKLFLMGSDDALILVYPEVSG